MTGLACFLAGFTAAEGSFTGAHGSSFAFRVALGASDGATCSLLRDFFGVGFLQHSSRRLPHYDDECSYSVTGAEQLARAIVPFMDAHLPRDSYKWVQYERWRDELLTYRANRVRIAGGRLCTIDGCEERARAKGLCRHHYFEAYRR